MNKEYTRINWVDYPSVNTPLGAINLNKMDYQVDKNENSIITFDITKANQSDLNQSLKNLTYDSTTGTFTFYYWNGDTQVVDLNIEKIPVAFSMSPAGVITMTTSDGSVYTADVASLIKTYTFNDSAEIDFTTTTDASGNKNITASLVAGSITGEKLQPNYLADVTVQAGIASTSASASTQEALVSEGWAKGTQEGEAVGPDSPYYHNNSKYYSEQSEHETFGSLLDVEFTNLQDDQVPVYDSVSGKWKNGEGGKGSFSSLSDVEFENLQNGQVPVYNSTTQKWENANGGTGGGTWGSITGTLSDQIDLQAALDSKQKLLWKGTAAEYEAQESQIPNGTEVYITDDVGEAFTSWGNIIGDIEDQEDLMDALNSKGGGGSIVRVTFDESQAGRTITFSMSGMETKTETVPTVSPYVIEISTMELGNLTITDTFSSKTMVVNIETYTLYSINFIVAFILQDWLNAGGVVGTYADLNAVFADEKAVRRLMTVHAAVDYLVSVCETDADNNVVTIINNDICAKWINLRDYALDTLYSNEYIASEMDTADKYFYGEWIEKDGVWQPKGNVPVMTSNSSPYGTCFGSNISSASPAYYAFDNNDNTRCETTGLNVTSGQYVGYTFVNPVKMKRAIVTTYKDQNSAPTYTIKFQASNDGFVNEIVDISDSIVVTNDVDKKKVVCNLNATKYYSSYRLYYESYTGIYAGQYYFNVVELNFYGRELSVSVPKMTSNTEPWGEAIKDSEYDASGYYSAYKAFNKSNATSMDCWSPASVTTDYHYIGYDFTKKTLVKHFSITNRAGTEVFPVGQFILQGSDDGLIWEDIHEYSNTATVGNATSYYDVTEQTSYKMYRIRAYGYYCMGELQFFGLDYSEREFAPGSTMKYIYDHGVELEEIDINGYAPVTGSLKFEKSNYNIHGTIPTQGGYERIAGTQNKIDLTDYVLAFLNTSLSTPKEIYIDISSVNSENYVAFDTYDNSGTVPQVCLFICSNKNRSSSISSKDINNRVPLGTEVEFNEMWLE